MIPYTSVAQNPEMLTDPGQMYIPLPYWGDPFPSLHPPPDHGQPAARLHLGVGRRQEPPLKSIFIEERDCDPADPVRFPFQL